MISTAGMEKKWAEVLNRNIRKGRFPGPLLSQSNCLNIVLDFGTALERVSKIIGTGVDFVVLSTRLYQKPEPLSFPL